MNSDETMLSEHEVKELTSMHVASLIFLELRKRLNIESDCIYSFPESFQRFMECLEEPKYGFDIVDGKPTGYGECGGRYITVVFEPSDKVNTESDWDTGYLVCGNRKYIIRVSEKGEIPVHLRDR
jgi:hypothetical protein